MMQPSEALSTAAQVSVTLAGFAGIVVVFRTGRLHEWSGLDKLRLRILLTNSILPLGLSLIAMLFLSTNLSAGVIWRISSGLTAIMQLLIGASYSRAFRALPTAEATRTPGAGWTFYIGAIIGSCVALFQVYNIVWAGAFWPFFLGVVLLIFAAITQFVRMLFVKEPHDDAK
jgi:hypothetical protein